MATPYLIPPGLVTKVATALGATPDQVNAALDARIADGTLAALTLLLESDELINLAEFALAHGLTDVQVMQLGTMVSMARNVRLAVV